jgi:hypothetical protein
MNLYKYVLLYLVIIMLIGCGKKESDQYIAGYINPGDFCSKGLAGEKAYRFTNASKSCSTGANCAAVHCNWYVSESLTSFNNAFPTEGIGANDRHLAQPTFDFKLTRVVGTPWTAEMILNGVRYTAININVRLTTYQSADFTDQTWDPETSACVASTTPLNIMYVEFLDTFNMLSDPHDNPAAPTKPYIQILQTPAGGSPTSPPASGDFMVVQAY